MKEIGNITNSDQEMYEKILLAYYLSKKSFDGEKYRSTIDDCLYWLIKSNEDRETSAYLQFEYLRGRGENSLSFIKDLLGVVDDENAYRELFYKYELEFIRYLDSARKQGSWKGERP